jgi:hypothetical protein
MEKRLTGVRVELSTDGAQMHADCNLFLESFGPPARWHGRLWNVSAPARLKKGAKVTLKLPQGATADAVIQRADTRGAYDFQGEGLPPAF